MNARYPIRRCTIKPISVPRGVTNVLHENVYKGSLPERIILGMVTDVDLTGGYKHNPFNFQHFNVNHLVLTLDDMRNIPSRPFQPDFSKKKYIRDYASLFETMGLLFGDKTISINRDDYANGYTFWGFDLTPDKNCSQSVSVATEKSVRLEVKFANTTTETINIILYAEFDSVIEIDQYRNVIGPF